MTSRPSGTVTFLFTDIEGSTRLWEVDAGGMRAALARHDSLLRATVEQCGGQTVKHRGDGFLFVFSTAHQAIEAAVEAQRAISAEPWGETSTIRVRMAIHTGEAEERDGDYFGPALNRAARLLDVGHGGQILITGATEQLVRDNLTHEISLRDLGQHQFGDLERGDHLYQVDAPVLADSFPPLRTFANRPGNLPVHTTSFFGHARDIAEITRLLKQSRLVTLIGAGGVGKTRLALEVVRQMPEDYRDGIWFIDLSPLSDPSLLSQTVATALGIKVRQGELPSNTLLNALRDRQLLLLLDNCEHLIEAVAQFTNDLLRTCSLIRIMATSREPLRLAEEVRWHVSPLTVPDVGWHADLEQFGRVEAVQLFLDRATAIAPGFRLTSANQPYIVEIVRNLDGIPLAIELAAARVNVLSVEQIARRLDDRFRLLRRGSRGAFARQQTLEALIDWSYDLLTEDERSLFQRLSVFPGSFALEAVEAIAADENTGNYETLERLSRLVEKSLVVVDEHDREFRYRMLESLREYARNHLRESGLEEQLQHQHGIYFLLLAEQSRPNLSTEDLARLRAESDNFRAVLDWSRIRNPEIGLRLATALWQVWWLGGQISEGRSQMERLWATSTEHIPAEIRLDALHARGYLSFRDADYTAARTHFEEMHRLARETGDLKRVLMAVRALGGTLVEQTDYDAAAPLLRESLRLEGQFPDVPASPLVRVDLGLVELDRGDYAEAARLFQESRDMAERDSDNWRIVMARASQGLVALAQNNVSAAREDFVTTLRLAWDDQMLWVIPIILEGHAALAVKNRLLHRAVRLAAAATMVRERVESQSAPLWQQLLNPPLEQARQELDERAWEEIWAEGQAMSIEQAIEYAISENEEVSAQETAVIH